MSWSPYVFGVGKYKKEIKDFLPYPPDWYADVKEGQIVCGTIGWLAVRSQAEEFLQILNMDWQSMDWVIDKAKISNIDEALETYSVESTCVVELLESCSKLLKANWRLFFDPGA